MPVCQIKVLVSGLDTKDGDWYLGHMFAAQRSKGPLPQQAYEEEEAQRPPSKSSIVGWMKQAAAPREETGKRNFAHC